jgi:hypothetical protein
VVADVVGVEGVHEAERAVVEGQAEDGHVVGVHHAVHEADRLPVAISSPVRRPTSASSASYGFAASRHSGRKRVDHVIGELAQADHLALVGQCSKEPKRMKLGARRVTTAAVSVVFAAHRGSSRADHAQGPGGGYAEGGHGLGTEEFADARAQHGTTVGEARVGRLPGALELDFPAAAGPVRTPPSRWARPSPSCPAHTPNWWPEYTAASGSLPGSSVLPANIWGNSGRLSSAGSSPISPATSALAATR